MESEEEITIKEIQEWEKRFVKKKNIALDEETSMKIAIFKLVEEVGEVSKAALEGKWNEIQAEVADAIVFLCKVANNAEQFHNTEELSKVFRRKIGYCETRVYDEAKKKFDKPENNEFK